MRNAMTRLRAMNGIREEDLIMATSIIKNEQTGRHYRRRRVVSFALAAALILALSVTAFAAYSAVGTPQAAERVAREQIEVWKELGLLNRDVNFEGSATKIIESPEVVGSDYWYGRLFAHSYDVRWYLSGRKYGCNLVVDTLSGKITAAFIDARADEDAVPVREEVTEEPADPMDPNNGTSHTYTWYFYDNYTDIFPADMTVDRFCTLLAQYWGFTGYRIAETNDSFYQSHYDPIDGSTLLKDINGDTRQNYYITVFFDGDQEGAPMYIQLNQFPGYVNLTVGTNHGVG